MNVCECKEETLHAWGHIRAGYNRGPLDLLKLYIGEFSPITIHILSCDNQETTYIVENETIPLKCEV